VQNTQEIFSNNLIELRKHKKLTQQEFADILGYSDKSVSKWEGQKAIPNAETLLKIAEFYNVSVDALLKEKIVPTAVRTDDPKQKLRNQILLIAMAACFVLIVASCVYINEVLQSEDGSDHNMWIAFVWTIPGSLLAASLMGYRFFGKKLPSLILSSLFIWTFLFSFSLTYYLFVGQNIFFILFVGIPVQVALVFYFSIKK